MFQSGLQQGSAIVQGNQYAVQLAQFAKQTAQLINSGFQLDAMMRNLTDPQWYYGQLAGTPTYQQGMGLYGVSQGTSAKSTRDAARQAQTAAQIASMGAYNQPASAVKAAAVDVADSSKAEIAQASAKQSDLAIRSGSIDKYAEGAAKCDGTNDCQRSTALIASENAQVSVGIASTLATQQANAAADRNQRALDAAKAAQVAADMEKQRKANQSAFMKYFTAPTGQ
jgi:hypothetical protein